MTTTVTIYHNISRDAFFGLNTVLTDDGKATQPGTHPLVKVYAYEIDMWKAGGFEALWKALNVGDDPEFNGDMPLADVLLAQAYRERKLRSLSVGDVVRVGNRWFTVASAGWTEVKAAELQILDTEAAEAAVREMFQMTSDEELTVTVPLS